LQLRERIRLALGLARSISHAPATHLARSSQGCACQLVKLYYMSCICIAPNMGALCIMDVPSSANSMLRKATLLRNWPPQWYWADDTLTSVRNNLFASGLCATVIC
jgi:hypothetical protein